MVIPKWLLVIALLASGSEHVTEREGMIPEMSTEIELTLTNELPFEREAEPVTCGVPEVRVFYTLHNPAAHRHPGNIWDLASADLRHFCLSSG